MYGYTEDEKNRTFAFGVGNDTFCDRNAIILVPLESWDHLLFKTSKMFEKDLETADKSWFENCRVENVRKIPSSHAVQHLLCDFLQQKRNKIEIDDRKERKKERKKTHTNEGSA